MNYREEVLKNCPAFTETSLSHKLSLGGLGVAGEAGEIADIIKKLIHHRSKGQEIWGVYNKKWDDLVKEMGDVYWYLEYLGATLGISTEDIMKKNIEKLKKRHPEGWTPESQRAKADENQEVK